jgi:thioredoxin 1
MSSDAVLTDAIAAADGLVMVDCWADWCGPCRMLSPVVDVLGADLDDLTVMKVDIDAEPAFARRFDVLSVPTLLFFRDGRLVHRLVGARPKRALVAEIEALGVPVA